MTNGTKSRKAGLSSQIPSSSEEDISSDDEDARSTICTVSSCSSYHEPSFYFKIGRNSIYDLHCNGELMALIAGTNVIVLV